MVDSARSVLWTHCSRCSPIKSAEQIVEKTDQLTRGLHEQRTGLCIRVTNMFVCTASVRVSSGRKNWAWFNALNSTTELACLFVNDWFNAFSRSSLLVMRLFGKMMYILLRCIVNLLLFSKHFTHWWQTAFILNSWSDTNFACEPGQRLSQGLVLVLCQRIFPPIPTRKPVWWIRMVDKLTGSKA